MGSRLHKSTKKTIKLAERMKNTSTKDMAHQNPIRTVTVRIKGTNVGLPVKRPFLNFIRDMQKKKVIRFQKVGGKRQYVSTLNYSELDKIYQRYKLKKFL